MSNLLTEHNCIEVRDIDGILRLIPLTSKQDVTLFGMDISTIAEFRKQYLKRNGTLPITKDKVNEIFNEQFTDRM